MKKPNLMIAALVGIALISLSGTAFAQGSGGGSLGDIIMGGGVIGWVIILLSIVSLALAIEHFVTIRRDKLVPPELIDEIEALFEEEEYQEALELCESEPNYLTNILSAGLPKINAGFEARLPASARPLRRRTCLRVSRRRSSRPCSACSWRCRPCSSSSCSATRSSRSPWRSRPSPMTSSSGSVPTRRNDCPA